MALHNAARDGQVDEINKLLAQGGDINTRDKHSRTPLHLAAWAGQLEAVKALTAGHCNVGAEAKDNMNALHFAAQKGHTEVCRALLNAGVAVNAKNRKGLNALQMAAQNGHFELVTLLVKRKADINAKNKAGLTALELAGGEDIKEVLKKAAEDHASSKAEALDAEDKPSKPQQHTKSRNVRERSDDIEQEEQALDPFEPAGPPTAAQKPAAAKKAKPTLSHLGDNEEEDS